MQKLLYIIAAFITITFSSCESEISVLDPQVFDGSLDQIQLLVGADAYTKFTGILEIPIYEGSNTPPLNGEYILFQILQTADAIDPNSPANGRILGGLYIKIELSNQDFENGRIDYSGSVWGVGLDGIPGTGDDEFLFFETKFSEAFVSGSALPNGTGAFNVFSLDNAGTIALSGSITPDGIIDLKYGFVTYNENNTIDSGNTWVDEDGFSPNL
jgi:hypothetical protein